MVYGLGHKVRRNGQLNLMEAVCYPLDASPTNTGLTPPPTTNQYPSVIIPTDKVHIRLGMYLIIKMIFQFLLQSFMRTTVVLLYINIMTYFLVLILGVSPPPGAVLVLHSLPLEFPLAVAFAEQLLTWKLGESRERSEDELDTVPSSVLLQVVELLGRFDISYYDTFMGLLY